MDIDLTQTSLAQLRNMLVQVGIDQHRGGSRVGLRSVRSGQDRLVDLVDLATRVKVETLMLMRPAEEVMAGCGRPTSQQKFLKVAIKNLSSSTQVRSDDLNPIKGWLPVVESLV